MRLIFLQTLILIAAAGSAVGQNTAGSIEGSVRDLNNRGIAEATVYAYPEDDMRRRVKTITDARGRYALRNLAPRSYYVHAFKESEGYADNFFSFFSNRKKGWLLVKVQAGLTAKDVVIELGPRYATLKLHVRDESDKPTGASISFVRMDDPERPYSRGGDLSGTVIMLVPTVPFHFMVEKEGYRTWNSERISLQPGETITVTARLAPNR